MTAKHREEYISDGLSGGREKELGADISDYDGRLGFHIWWVMGGFNRLIAGTALLVSGTTALIIPIDMSISRMQMCRPGSSMALQL